MTAYAQSSVYQEQYGSNDGIDIDQIKAITVDNDGFVWLGGMSLSSRDIIAEHDPIKLLRFDGNEFQSIYFPADLGEEIRAVEHFTKRPDGKFYVSVSTKTESALLFLFDPFKATFSRVDLSKYTQYSRLYYEDSNAYILLKREGRIYLSRLTENTEVVELFSFRPGIQMGYSLDDNSRMIHHEGKWIICDDNFPIHVFNETGQLLKVFPEEGFVRKSITGKSKEFIRYFFQVDTQLYVLLFEDKQLYRFNAINNTLAPTGSYVSSERVKPLIDGDFDLVDFKDGKSMLGKIKDGNIVYQSDIHQRRIASNEVTGAYFDTNKQQLWLSSNTGINYLKYPPTQVKRYLEGISIRSLFQTDENEFLIATENKGLYTLNLKKGSLEKIELKEKGELFNIKSSRGIYKVNDILWTSSGSGIASVDLKSNTVSTYRNYPVISTVMPDEKSLVYGTNGFNLVRFDLETKSHINLVSTKDLFIYDLAYDPTSDIITGATDKGVFFYNYNTGDYQFQKDIPGVKEPYFLMVDYLPHYGFIYGTKHGEVLSYNTTNPEWKTIYKDVKGQGIGTLIQDDDATLWIHTFDGVVHFNPVSTDTRRFSVADGFSHNEANRYSALKTDRGILMGTLDGLNYYEPEVIENTVNNGRIVLLSYTIYDKKQKKLIEHMDRSAFAKAETITLPSENKSIKLSYGVTNMDLSHKETYRYRLNKEEWVDLGEKQELQFYNLASGTYDLEVQAVDYSGESIEKPLQLAIYAKPFFYKTWWFLLSLVGVVLAVLLYIIKQLQDRRRLQEQYARGLIQSQEEERLRIAKELHDGVGQQLTMIKRMAHNKTDESIASLTSDALDEIRAISRGLYPVRLQQLGLKASIEQLLYEIDEQTDYFVTVVVDDIDACFTEEQALNVYRFIQEGVSNAVKHSKGKAIEVFCEMKGKTVSIEISDNGKGFNYTEDSIYKNSLGMKTLAERIAILNGSIEIASTIGKGTTLIAILPIHE